MSATKNAENVWNHLNTQFVNHLCYSSLTSHQFILIELKIGEGNHSFSYSSVARWSRLGIGLTELGIALRIKNARRTVWPRVSGLNFYDLNELFMRGCSFPVSSISRLHEPYRQNMRIIRFRLCPDGYGPPRLAKIKNRISIFSTSIFSRMPRKSINKTKIMKKQKKCESISWIKKILCWTDGLTHGQLWLCVCVGGGRNCMPLPIHLRLLCIN